MADVIADVPPKPVCPTQIRASDGATSGDMNKDLRYFGIMGSICKHYSVYKMLNISSRDEKYIFARTILESIVAEPWARTLLFKYHIWCNFLPYLQNRNFVGIPLIAGIPIGHSLTHLMSCQYKYFPWLVKGNGSSPGEEIETLWSKLRFMWARIREMSPGTREDSLSDAIEQINQLMLEELPWILLKQLNRVDSTRTLCQDEIDNLRLLFPKTPLSDEIIDNLDLSSFAEAISTDWKVVYVRYLLEYNKLHGDADANDPDTPEFNAIHTRLRSITKILTDTEEKRRICRYNSEKISIYREAALTYWVRELKADLRTNLVMEEHCVAMKSKYRNFLRVADSDYAHLST
jgi:hypothetical protein